MDLNLVVICGRLAVDAELKTFESGTQMVRLLITVRSDEPRRRVDVVPVTYWDPSTEFIAALPAKGTRVWVAGSVQRRFWEQNDGRKSRLEVVAAQVNVSESADLALTSNEGN